MNRHTCCASIWDKYSFRSNACGKTAKMEHEGKHYCGIHDPLKNAKKAAEREAQWAKEREESARKFRLTQAAPEMLALLIESQASIGGDWRERRDAIITKLTEAK